MSATLTACRTTVAAILQGTLIKDDDDEEYTTRGLEYMTTEGFDISQNIKEIVQWVLEEQTRQREEETPESSHSLADILATASAHRSRVAHLIGMRDARAVHDAQLPIGNASDNNPETSDRSNLWKRRSEPVRGTPLGVNTSFSRRRERQPRSSLQTSHSCNATGVERIPPLRVRSSGLMRRLRTTCDISATPTPGL